MKTFAKVFLIFVVPMMISFISQPSFYNIEVVDISGEKIDLIKYRDKKILVIALSPSYLFSVTKSLSKLKDKYGSSLVIIGVPCKDFGFREGNKLDLIKYRVDNKLDMILTAEMNQKQESRVLLIDWLRKKEFNAHFDVLNLAPGHKFFVSKSGILFSVLGPQTSLSHSIVEKNLSSKSN